MNNIKRIKMNAIKGCVRREILRYLKEPMQTIINAIFSNLLFFLILYLINTKNISLLIPGIIIFLSFDVISSNLRMTLFVGRLEKTVFYQVASCVSRVTLYTIYVISSVIRALTITSCMLIIFKLFFKNIVINNLILYLAWTICIDIVFANIGMLLGLFSKNWNSVAAVQDYIVSPVMYLSGCFFSINQVPDLVKRFVQINPIFHFFNISNYLFSGQAEYDLRISFLMCISIAILSTMVCYVIFKKGYGLLK